MSIPVPADLPIVAYEDLIGDVALDDQPLDTILDAVNWLYAGHTPALWNLAPVCPAATHTHDWVWPAVPSADGLTYDILVYGACATPSPDLVLDLSYGTSSSGPWTGVTGWFSKTFTYGALESEAWDTDTATLPASATFWKLTASFTSHGAAQSGQIQSFSAAPVVLKNISSGAKSSGFAAYDSTMLQSADGGTIHTELFERALANVTAIMRDRHQMVFSYVDELTVPNYAYSMETGRNATETAWIFRGRTSLAGQGGGPDQGARILVQCRADDQSGASGVVVVGEEGGESVSFDADDTDQSAYLDLQSDTPILYARAHPTTTGTGIYPRYITGRWIPGED